MKLKKKQKACWHQIWIRKRGGSLNFNFVLSPSPATDKNQVRLFRACCAAHLRKMMPNTQFLSVQSFCSTKCFHFPVLQHDSTFLSVKHASPSCFAHRLWHCQSCAFILEGDICGYFHFWAKTLGDVPKIQWWIVLWKLLHVLIIYLRLVCKKKGIGWERKAYTHTHKEREREGERERELKLEIKNIILQGLERERGREGEKEREREREREREGGRETERERERQRLRERQRQRERDREWDWECKGETDWKWERVRSSSFMSVQWLLFAAQARVLLTKLSGNKRWRLHTCLSPWRWRRWGRHRWRCGFPLPSPWWCSCSPPTEPPRSTFPCRHRLWWSWSCFQFWGWPQHLGPAKVAQGLQNAYCCITHTHKHTCVYCSALRIHSDDYGFCWVREHVVYLGGHDGNKLQER